MCGRFSLTFTYEDLLEYFELANGQPLVPRYNIAPSQDVIAVRVEEGERRLIGLRWGLVPFWAKDPKVGYKMINARAETAHKAPAFRAAFRDRRCIIPSSGFYEWDKKGGSRQPFYVQRADGKPLAFAGLWEHWEDKEGKTVIESCTLLTTDANPDIERLHDRMPAILEPQDFDLWLDPEERQPGKLQPLLRPSPAGTLTMYPVSTYVNKATNEGEKCVKAVMEKDK
jgi:putative SOS response-associated peptidase YedK